MKSANVQVHYEHFELSHISSLLRQEALHIGVCWLGAPINTFFASFFFKCFDSLFVLSVMTPLKRLNVFLQSGLPSAINWPFLTDDIVFLRNTQHKENTLVFLQTGTVLLSCITRICSTGWDLVSVCSTWTETWNILSCLKQELPHLVLITGL